MSFIDAANKITPKTTTSKLTSKFSVPDVNTAGGLQEYAASKGVSVEQPQQSLLSRGLTGFSEVLTAPSKALTAVATGKYELPSESMFGKAPEQASLGEALKYQFFTLDGLKRFAVDTALDPLTYLTLGTGTAIKVVSQQGSKVALSKTGKELLNDLATEIVDKSAGRITRNEAVQIAGKKVAAVAAPEGATILERGGLDIIKKAAEKTGKKLTATEVKNIISKGATELIAQPEIRFAGAKIASLPKTSELVSSTVKALESIPNFKATIKGIEDTVVAATKMFNRDFALPKEFIPIKQKYIDSFDSAVARAKGNIKLIFAKSTPEQRVAITRAIESGTIHTLDKETRKLAKRVQDIFAAIGKEEEERGLLNSTVDDYVTHLYKNTEQAKKIVAAIRAGQPSALLKFNKTRLFLNLEEAKAAGLEPIEDIAHILAIRLIASEKATLTQDFIKNVGVKFGKNLAPELERMLALNGEAFIRFSDVVAGAPKEFKNLQLPQNIAEDIASMGKRFFEDESANKLLRGYDKLLNFFKGSVTVLFPAFHARNAVSNTMLNFLDIGISAFNPVVHKTAVDILTGAEGKLVTELGEEISYSQIRKLAKANQVFQDTLARTDVGRILDPTILQKTSPVDLGRKVGRAIENEARFVNFITNLKRGFSPDDAANRTKQFLFDYDNLSLFEKDVMRRFIPFYTFTRKNIALQLREIARQPGKQAIALRMFKTLNDMIGRQPTDEEKQLTPEYLADSANIMLERKGDDRTFLVGFDLPLESAISDVSDLIQEPFLKMLNLSAPFIKIPVETATGKNLFTGIDIKDDDSGNFAKNLPEGVKNWMEYSEKEITTKDGDTFTLIKVNPEKKFVWRNATALTGISRAVSASTLNGIIAMYKGFKGETMGIQDKADVLRFWSGVSAQTISIEAQRKKQEKAQSEELMGKLEREGFYVPSFERRFIPKETGKLKKSKLKTKF